MWFRSVSLKLGAVISALLWSMCLLPGFVAAEGELELIYFGHNDDAALLGIGHGLDESAERAGAWSFNLRVVGTDHFRPFRSPKPIAILAAADAESLRILAQLNPEVAVFNLIEDFDDLRAICMPNLFHMLPSARMRADALALSSLVDDGEALAWHDSLEDPQAAAFVERFRKARKTYVSEQTYSGWLAAQFLADALAVGAEDGSELLEYLRSGASTDDFKGVRNGFRETGQLSQAILIVQDDKVIEQLPRRGSAPASLDDFGSVQCP